LSTGTRTGQGAVSARGYGRCSGRALVSGTAARARLIRLPRASIVIAAGMGGGGDVRASSWTRWGDEACSLARLPGRGGESVRHCSHLMHWLELGDQVLALRCFGGERRGAGDKGERDWAAPALLRQWKHCSCSCCQQGVRRNSSMKFKFEFLNEFWWVSWCWSLGSRYMASTKFGTGLVHISKYGQVLIC
jgi:hypothetical protein